MSDKSDLTDIEGSDNDDNKDSDFNIEDYEDGVDSEASSYEGLLKTKTDENHSKTAKVDDNNDDDEKEYVGPILPGGHRFDRKFVCIKYPGNVINPEKAIETLGGISAISTAVNTRNRRLELRFRPDDGYCKPACGDRHAVAGFLLRVRVKKKRIKNNENNTKETGKNIEVIEVIHVNKEITDNNVKNPGSDQSTQQNMNIPIEESNKEYINEQSEDKNIGKSMENLANQLNNCKVISTECETHDETEQSNTKKNIAKSNPKEEEYQSFAKNPVCPESKSNADNVSNNSNNTPETKSKENALPSFDSNKYEDLSQDEDYELPKLKVLGRIDTEFKFMNLCDFQYLPITRSTKNPKENECIYSSIYPTTVPPYQWLKNKVPYFLPPAAFSRMDNVQQYVPKTETDTLPQNIIGKTRKRRAGFSNFVYFNMPNVPETPPKGIESAMKVKFLQSFHLERVRKMFEQRPIWSKNALIYETKFTGDQLKILLPSVAYYFMNGPWRIMWVKLGYDPRTDPTSRKYQTLDYRLKAMHGLQATIKCKRSYSNYILPYKSAPISKPKTTVLTANLSQDQNRKQERLSNENMYIYREGTVPPSRQMFYQYCDVLVDEVQEMLAKLPDPPPGTKCHEKMGWLPNGFDDQCREIINKQVRVVLRKKMNIPEDHPTSLPRKRRFGGKVKRNVLLTRKSKKSKLLNPSSSSIHMEVVPQGSDEEWENCTNLDEPGTSSKVT
ncbi:general transcription factor 3C polypeptide 5 [Cephus cinctus]|uniref:General transcription factor 3C polypeptide 5 n=1 Tax=Cephus cinctus TaxID=211228 RepID=A0AAJ7CCB3_CEPCN|nr:general transcription factor 3C polypeptide 5 [Cephus cinctus]